VPIGATRARPCLAYDHWGRYPPFIYLWERHPRFFKLAETLFGYLKQPEVQGVTSVITLIEACVHPQRQGRPDLVAAYERALRNSQQVQMLPVDTALARRAVILRASYGIRVPDALQLAAAMEAGATLFVSNDRRLSKVQEIHVILLDDYVAQR
jgi:predicted nucleic acid-binding protein